MAPWKYEWGVMAFPDCFTFRLSRANKVPERDIVINHLLNEVKKGLIQQQISISEIEDFYCLVVLVCLCRALSEGLSRDPTNSLN